MSGKRYEIPFTSVITPPVSTPSLLTVEEPAANKNVAQGLRGDQAEFLNLDDILAKKKAATTTGPYTNDGRQTFFNYAEFPVQSYSGSDQAYIQYYMEQRRILNDSSLWKFFTNLAGFELKSLNDLFDPIPFIPMEPQKQPIVADKPPLPLPLSTPSRPSILATPTRAGPATPSLLQTPGRPITSSANPLGTPARTPGVLPGSPTPSEETPTGKEFSPRSPTADVQPVESRTLIEAYNAVIQSIARSDLPDQEKFQQILTQKQALYDQQLKQLQVEKEKMDVENIQKKADYFAQKDLKTRETEKQKVFSNVRQVKPIIIACINEAFYILRNYVKGFRGLQDVNEVLESNNTSMLMLFAKLVSAKIDERRRKNSPGSHQYLVSWDRDRLDVESVKIELSYWHYAGRGKFAQNVK